MNENIISGYEEIKDEKQVPVLIRRYYGLLFMIFGLVLNFFGRRYYRIMNLILILCFPHFLCIVVPLLNIKGPFLIIVPFIIGFLLAVTTFLNIKYSIILGWISIIPISLYFLMTIRLQFQFIELLATLIAYLAMIIFNIKYFKLGFLLHSTIVGSFIFVYALILWDVWKFKTISPLVFGLSLLGFLWQFFYSQYH